MPKIRVSIINVPTELSPLKLRGFLRGQAQDIQALAKHREDITVIRVFVPSRIVAALGVKKLESRACDSRSEAAFVYQSVVMSAEQD